MKRIKSFNLLNIFLVLLVLLALASVYFTFVKPISFSNQILREGTRQYAEIEMILSENQSWLRDLLPVGEESQSIYRQTDWKILEVKEQNLAGKTWTIVKVKALVIKESAGLLHYRNYTLLKGAFIYFKNEGYSLEGRIFQYRILNEKVLI